jgi:AmpD protein
LFEGAFAKRGIVSLVLCMDLGPDGFLVNGAEILASPNFDLRPNGELVSLVVIHCISLPPGIFGGDEVERFFANQLDVSGHEYFEQLEGVRVSSHFYIKRTGKTIQFVSCDKRAWHAGRSEFMGRENCNDFSIGIELEGTDAGFFEDSQYEALVVLIKALRSGYPITDCVGHSHVAIPKGRKSDPGIFFDWRRVESSVDIAGLHYQR